MFQRVESEGRIPLAAVVLQQRNRRGSVALRTHAAVVVANVSGDGVDVFGCESTAAAHQLYIIVVHPLLDVPEIG